MPQMAAAASTCRHSPPPSGENTKQQQRPKTRRRRRSMTVWLGGTALAVTVFVVQHVQVLRLVTNMDPQQTLMTVPPPPSSSKLRSKSAASQDKAFVAYTKTGANSNKTIRYGRHITTYVEKSTLYMKNFSGYYNAAVQEFQRQPGVVIVTKIHDQAYVPMLEQTLCLLHQAYNHRVLYNIVVFTTEFIPPELYANVTRVVHPAKLTVIQDNDGLQGEIAKLSPERRRQFLKDCGLDRGDVDETTMPSLFRNLTWWSDCGSGRISYNWQAEFRSWHIWKHSALQNYQWMMWLDADAFCSKVWTRDPIAVAIQHNSTILFDNFPQGHAGGRHVQKRIRQAFGDLLCNIELSPYGHFVRQVGEECKGDKEETGFVKGQSNIPLVHGFFHITNMDFFRSPPVMHWAETLIGNGFLQRKYDDQMAVTIPAAFLTPQRSWLLRGVGIELGVFHNGRFDGYLKLPGGGFLRRWNINGGKEAFPEAADVCRIVAGG